MQLNASRLTKYVYAVPNKKKTTGIYFSPLVRTIFVKCCGFGNYVISFSYRSMHHLCLLLLSTIVHLFILLLHSLTVSTAKLYLKPNSLYKESYETQRCLDIRYFILNKHYHIFCFKSSV